MMVWFVFKTERYSANKDLKNVRWLKLKNDVDEGIEFLQEPLEE